MAIDIRNLQTRVKLNQKILKDNIIKILKILNIRKAQLSVAFVNDYKIRRLNKKYRKKDRITDVLAFNMLEDGAHNSGRILGEVVISTDTAAKNAKRFKASLKDEINLYLIHGILHLKGYEDETKKDFRRMKLKQEEILDRI